MRVAECDDAAVNFRGVVDALPQAVALFARDGQCIFANRAFEHEIGRASFRVEDEAAWLAAIRSALAIDTPAEHAVASWSSQGPRRFVVSLVRIDDQVCATFVDA